MSDELSPIHARVDELLAVIQAVSEQDYSRRASIGDDEDDPLSGIAAGLNMMAEELQSSTALLGNVLGAMIDAVIVVGRDGKIVIANAAARRMLGGKAAEDQPFAAALAGAPGELSAAELLERFGSAAGVEVACVAEDGREIPVSLLASPLSGASAELEGAVCVARDITERRRAEEEQARLAAEVRRQQAALLELSTPLVPIAAGVVALPLVGAVDAARAAQLIDVLLRGIEQHGARAAILDITGVPVVDTQVAAAIMRAVQAARLLGTEVVLTGVRPEVARTLVALEIDLAQVVTRGTLDAGIRWAQRAAGPRR